MHIYYELLTLFLSLDLGGPLELGGQRWGRALRLRILQGISAVVV